MLSSSPVEAPTRSSPSVDRSDACLAGTTVPGSRSARKLATAAARVDRGAVASPVLFCQGHHVTTPPSSATRTIRDGGREHEVSTVMPGDPGWLLGCGRGDGYPDLLACAGWGRSGGVRGRAGRRGRPRRAWQQWTTRLRLVSEPPSALVASSPGISATT